MIRLRRRLVESDDGFVIFALLAMMIIGGIGLVILATVATSEHVNRHDLAFGQSLQAAESGLDEMTAIIKTAPLATSFVPIDDSDPATGGHWHVSATGGSGHWLVHSTGVAARADSTVTRSIQQSVDVQGVLNTPVFGDSHLAIGGASGASGVDTYDSAVSSNTCTAGGLPATLLSYDTRMCRPASPALGNVGTDGPLTMVGADVTRVASADIYDAPVPGFTDPDSTGVCGGDAATCAAVGSTVHLHHERLDYPLSSQCSQGVGAGASSYDGSFALAANTVYNFQNVTLNATAIANLSNLAASRIVVCFSGDLVIPPVAQLNSTVSASLPSYLTPRAPSTLILISTAPAPLPGPLGSVTAGPRVDFGLTAPVTAGVTVPVLSTLPTSISAVIYAPNAVCDAAGHVDVYGAIVCGSIDATGGLDDHYDVELGQLDFDRPVIVSKWQEVH